MQQFSTGRDFLNQFINMTRAIYESQYGDGIGTGGEATLSAQLDSERKILISITMEDICDNSLFPQYAEQI